MELDISYFAVQTTPLLLIILCTTYINRSGGAGLRFLCRVNNDNSIQFSILAVTLAT